MEKKQTKTNAVRILEQSGIEFEVLHYDVPEGTVFSGDVVSGLLGLDDDLTFKTLCARGKNGRILVFCVPVNCELSLKKAAAVSGEKKVEMVHVKELRDLTGYERGSVSPIGMKKQYPTFIDETAILFDKISVSGGAKGCSVYLSPHELCELVGADFCDIAE